MKYCSGKYHGNVKKQIEDNEDYCIICRGKIASEKEEKKKKRNKTLLNICKGVVAAIPIVLSAVNLAKSKDNS
jgi:hypothetical protein